MIIIQLIIPIKHNLSKVNWKWVSTQILNLFHNEGTQIKTSPVFEGSKEITEYMKDELKTESVESNEADIIGKDSLLLNSLIL